MTMSVDQMKLALEQKIQEQIQESNEQLSNIAIAPNVLSAIHGQVTDLLNSTVGASAPKAGVGASAPKNGLGDGPYSPFNGGGYVDQIAMDIANICRNPNDPTAIQQFMNDLGHLTPAELNDSDMQKLLAQFNASGKLSAMVTEMVEYSYFMGGGVGGGQSYINDMLAQLGNPPNNPLAAQMAGLLQGWNQGGLAAFDSQHGVHENGQYVLYWNIPNPTGAGELQLQWPGSSFSILQMIGNQSIGTDTNPYVSDLMPDPNTWIQTFMSQYRSDAINSLWAQTHNLGLLVMYLTMLMDGDSQSQQGGLSNTTNLLSDMTDKFANSLLTTGQNIGQLSTSDAYNFAFQLLAGTSIMNSESQFGGAGGIASSWTNNVVNPILGLTATAGSPPVTQTIGQWISAYFTSSGAAQAPALQNLTDALNSLNTAPSGGIPGPQPGYQSIINALQSGSGLLTGQSKTVSTQLSLVTNQDAQMIKFGSSNADSNGGGWSQMLLALINNQVSH